MENNGSQTIPLISLCNAVKTYGQTYALKNVNLSIYKGQSVAIFGPNGAGKSTLLKIISMQLKLSSGEFLYNNIPYKKITDNIRNSFGVISHQSFLYGGLSALENIKFYGKLYNIKNIEKKAEILLKKLDIYKRKDDLVRNFSKGLMQRVAIARALINNPETIFLDEPYSFLDDFVSTKLTDILKEQIENNKTIITVTHNIDTGLNLADNIIIMNKGKIVYNTLKSNINIDDFKNIYTKQIEALGA